MTLALYMLLALVAVGLVLRLLHKPSAPDAPAADTPAAGDGEEECCGMHITCERDSLLASVSQTIEYYDDEELDRFSGTAADAYSDDEIEQFRDILLTLLPTDIAGWARSLQLRGIELPAPVREELLMVVAEARAEAASHTS